MNEVRAETKIEGIIERNGQNIYSSDINVTELRRRVGMDLALPVPLPRSIFDNVAFGPRMAGIMDRKLIASRVVESLQKVALSNEVEDKLHSSALKLPGGQQQRLWIARVLAVEPEILLMDEPCSALDPMAIAQIEELMFKLKMRYPIVTVTHNRQQAARVSDFTSYFSLGELIEFGETHQIFTAPADRRTEE